MGNGRKLEGPGSIQRLWLGFEKVINAVTTTEYNPFYYLGAIGIFFLWVIFVSGIVLFIFYNVTARGAYESVQYLTVKQWYFGGVLRSLHRYAAQGLIIAGIVHTLRCFVLDRYKHWRWLAWVTGVILMWLVWIGGIFGYWMVWDERAKFIALSSARMLESIPLLGMPLSLTFASAQNVTDEFFYIILVIHFFSLFVVFVLLLVHLSRITKSVVNPPRLMIYGLVFLLLLVSLLHPATSAPAADLKRLGQSVPFDWLFMFVFPILKLMPAMDVWLLIATVTIVLSIVPWLTRTKKGPATVVTLKNCTGCELCMEDCPYEAIQMRQRTDSLPYELEAVVLEKRCASCGICTGSCDYKAMGLPDMTEDHLKAEIRRYSRELKDSVKAAKVLVFACSKGAFSGKEVPGFEWARVLTLQCIGQLQPSMAAIPFEEGIDAVFIAGCIMGDCSFRFGNIWLEERMLRHRPPVFRKSIDRARIRSVWLSAVDGRDFLISLTRFHEELEGSKAHPRTPPQA
jgi:quinol-cytochrome oxidoreductase complex cytochrome b subunit/coenzyme F420-reducing hydrogenase delta subunit